MATGMWCPINHPLLRPLLPPHLLPGPSHRRRRADGRLGLEQGRGLSLRERPATRASYATAILSFLRVAGYGKYLTDLSGHGVSTVGADVKHCQSAKNVTPCSSPSLAATTPLPPPGTSPIDHLWSAFLGGGSRRGGVRRRPFGDAVLDGVDFYLDGEAEQERFSDLVRH
ncbi:xylanase inhibitor protein 1-like [Setaria italica]|uniref:xylanase inhibitor protein 1-like n=1 Tax=Setaria italica TaxID=4555 RepID=UPI000BE55EBB|nr:xylanase inhibitor protein 1-like [Setaria italica]